MFKRAEPALINAPALSPQQQQWLDAALLACPRTANEKSPLAYARRLKERDPRLDNAALAKGSGAMVSHIEADPKIRAGRVNLNTAQGGPAAPLGEDRARDDRSRADEQKTPPEPFTGIQGQSGD